MARAPRGVPAIAITLMAVASALLVAPQATGAEPDYGGRDEAWIVDAGPGPLRFMQTDAAGNTYLLSSTYDPSTMRLESLEPNGLLRWQKTVQFTEEVDVDGLVVTRNGSSIFVAITRYYENHVLIATRSYSGSTGATRWTRSIRMGRNDHATDIAISPAGDRVYVTGTGHRVPSDHPPFVIARSTSDGTRSWFWRTNKLSLMPRDIAVRPGGRVVYLTGDGNDGASVVALRALNGVLRWHRRVATTEIEDYGVALAIDPVGQRLYVAAADVEEDWLDELPLDQIVVTAYRAKDGMPLWRHRVIGPNDLTTRATGLVATADSVVVTGQATLDPPCRGEEDCYETDSDMITVSLGAWHGVVRWRDRYDGSVDAGHTSLDAAHDVAAHSGVIYVSGSEQWDGNWIATTIAYDGPTGTESWIGRSPAISPWPWPIAGVAYTPGQPGRIVLAGTGGTDAVAIAYEA